MGAFRKFQKLSLTQMKPNSAFSIIIFALLLTVSLSDHSEAFCSANCDNGKALSNKSYMLGDSYQIAQAVLDTTEMEEDNREGQETDAEVDIDTQDYDSLLLEAAKYA